MILFMLVISVILFWLADRLSHSFQLIDGNIMDKLSQVFSVTNKSITEDPLMISLEMHDLAAGIGAVCIVLLVFLYNFASKKNYRKGEEHGSAKWGKVKDIKPYTNSDPDLNIILSEKIKINALKTKKFEYDRNKNIVVVGGSGSGKTYSVIKPNLMQLNGSYVITDPKGLLLSETGEMFREAGYRIKTFNTVEFSKSLHYNPLAYIKSEKDILKVVNVLIENTSKEGVSAEKFWIDCERLLYTAIIAYIIEKLPYQERNIPTMIDMIEEIKIGDENHKNAIDILYEELESELPECLAVKQYRKFKLAAGDTIKGILISCSARLAAFDIKELREITAYDELELDSLGDKKTAFYIIMSDTDSTYSFLIAMIMYQMFNVLCEKADTEYQGELIIPVMCLFDEFANCGKIPGFHQLISTIRSRKISAMIILQSLSQIKSIYKDDFETIIDNCDTFVFLGGKSTSTTEQIARMIGKTTIDTQNISESKGNNPNYSLNNSNIARDLIDPAEIGKIGRNECIVLITGLSPFRDKKYNPKAHKRFKSIADGGASRFEINSNNPDHEEPLQIFIKEILEMEEISK